MAHAYSVEIHDFLGEMMAEAIEALRRARADGDEPTQARMEGRMEELEFFRRYLQEKIDLKTQRYF